MHAKLACAAALVLGALTAPALARPAKAQTVCTGEVIAARQQSGTFGGRKVAYSSCVERFSALGADGQPAASITAISYIAHQAPANRPVLFVFNGGPIVSSFILHMGAFGPKRLAVPDDITVPPDQFQLVDNPHAPLDLPPVPGRASRDRRQDCPPSALERPGPSARSSASGHGSVSAHSHRSFHQSMER